MFNINSIIENTLAEGPGKRLAIWFQGCDINCKGCSNKEMQEFTPKILIELDELINIIKKTKINYEIEGVTLLGGEPLLQNNILYLLTEIKKLDLTILLFTGKLYHEVSNKILQNIDVLIDGPFIKEKKDTTRTLIGSSNQNIYCLTNVYNEADFLFKDKRIDIHLSQNILHINGQKI